MRALWDYLDTTIDVSRIAEIDAHLAQCKTCHANAVFERRLLDTIARLRLSLGDADALRARIVESLVLEKPASR